MYPISVIVPLGKNESSVQHLIDALLQFEAIHEIVISTTKCCLHETPLDTAQSKVKWVISDTPPGRARQLNAGAAHSSGNYLWFVHADSRLAASTIKSMMTSIIVHPSALFYCDLKFKEDGPNLMALNQFGAWIRSRYLGLPFGDQGLCISAENFRALGGYDENVQIGEDHLFVWKVKRAGMPIIASGGIIETSARKYAQNGWLSVTYSHLLTTGTQAWREWRRSSSTSGISS